MSLTLAGYEPDAFIARRNRLASALDTRVALIGAGGLVSRNYPAQTFPFRASSHFLYLVGLPLIDGMLLIEGDEHTLYLPVPAQDDALWHGATPSHAEIAQKTKCRVRPLSALGDALGGSEACTVAAPDAATRARQTALLGREIVSGHFEPEDLPLIDALISLRLVHDDAAIESLRSASAVTTAAHLAAMAATAPGLRESEVRAAFDAIVVAEDSQLRLRPDRHRPR